MVDKKIQTSLLIGLGGTGQKILLETKRSFLEARGEIPKNVRFLVFDTDEAEPLKLAQR